MPVSRKTFLAALTGAAAVPAAANPGIPTPEPPTATQRFREQVDDTLKWQFGEFLEDASPEDKHLMHQVLSAHQSFHAPIIKSDELPLAVAFEEAIEGVLRQATYIRVPNRRYQAVREVLASSPDPAA